MWKYLDTISADVSTKTSQNNIGKLLRKYNLPDIDLNKASLLQVWSVAQFLKDADEYNAVMYRGQYFLAVFQYSPGFIIGLTQDLRWFDTALDDWNNNHLDEDVAKASNELYRMFKF